MGPEQALLWGCLTADGATECLLLFQKCRMKNLLRIVEINKTIGLYASGPDVATWLANSSLSTGAGAGDQSGEHKSVFVEPHLATGSNRSDGTPTGEKLISFFSMTAKTNTDKHKHVLVTTNCECLEGNS